MDTGHFLLDRWKYYAENSVVFESRYPHHRPRPVYRECLVSHPLPAGVKRGGVEALILDKTKFSVEATPDRLKDLV
jgi:hypothetical protein